MSIVAPDTLRYIKRNQLVQEQKIMANYYQDLIRSYGVDVLYIKRDDSYVTSGYTTDLIYGHQTTPTYILSSNMVTYMEVDSSILALNGMGLIPQDELTFYFSINDFGVCFANETSQYAEYPITPISGYVSYTATNINGNFISDVIDGTYSYNISSSSLSGENICLDIPVSGLSTPAYSITTNPYIHTSFSSTISGGYASPNLFLTFNRGLYKGKNRTFYSISGYVLYSDLELALKHSTKVKPNVGDIVRIDFPGGEQLEEYELTEVLTRRPTSTEGVNPLLGKYVWRCKANRRIASYETINNIDEDIQNEKATEDLMDIIKKTQKDKDEKFKLVKDYSNTTVDNVYGGYDISENLVKYPDQYVIEEPLSTSGYFIIQDFNNNSSIVTDGNDLFYNNVTGNINLTNNVSGNTYSNSLSSDTPDMMYLKIKEGNIYFTSSIVSGDTYISNKLTNFTSNNKKEQFSFDYIIQDVNNKYNLIGSSSYIFKSDRFAILSTGLELIAINEKGDESLIEAL